MPTYTARNVVEAIWTAEELQAAGKYDLFRGQLSATWDCVPSLFRVPAAMRAMAADAARRYRLWVGETPGFEDIYGDPDLAGAVAQHHGLPTRLLDFTTSPKIAGFFATDGDCSAHAEGAIILLRSSDVTEMARILPGRVLRVLRPRLENLWRMTAQRGVFVETEFPSLEYLGLTARITFPHDEATSGLAREEIYPQQSPLEILLRQYFDNESALRSMRDVEAMFRHDEIVHYELPTWEKNREYFQPDGLDPLDSWRPELIAPWLAVGSEPLAGPEARSLSLPCGLPASVFGDSVRDQVRAQLSDSPMRTKRIRWRCEIEGTNAGDGNMAEFADLLGAKLGLLWDGLRRLPYDDTVLADGMGLCAAILRGQHSGRSERDVLEELLGPVTKIGFGAADGSGASAYGANARLRQALRRDLLAHAAPAHREVFGELTTLLQLETRPQYLYEFDELSDLFGRQIAPIQTVRYGNDQVIFFSPGRVQSFGLA
jgi:hypothetical protein